MLYRSQYGQLFDKLCPCAGWGEGAVVYKENHPLGEWLKRNLMEML
ncbi:hypothetical protein CLOSTMETH_03811 [[Clostridium] methylpentosum DSM 5476]|jgi:hypothetical protein|uniref:Uncharacterized protein n=1 Tax=[Clostridium] methylpentosum DSM 5476 TaxID=537013 RepID=C0EIW5_9FIRM|nr:hypothetical protein CLOSTMETH_03811 [[Clostridium] methylpentosum DSM 5476]